MSKLKVYKSKHETWDYSPNAIGFVISHGWIMMWNTGDTKERVGCNSNRLSYAEFEYGYCRFRKRVLIHYKKGWKTLMRELYGDDYA